MKSLWARFGGSVATIVIVIAAALTAVWMWHRYEGSPWTRDGRVRAEVVRITPDISGLVTSVSVHDNQIVKAGDLLFVIDTPRYALALEEAEARVSSAAAILQQARREAQRDLALGELVATEAHEKNVASVATAQAALSQAKSQLNRAKLDLARTEVRASVNGVVTNLDLHNGDYVAAGKQAMALIDRDSIRIEGYFEETKLSMICIGAPARVRLMGEEIDLSGRVESISYGVNDSSRSDSGNLLPSVDPTFSWVRLAQRIPVRIKLGAVPRDLRLITGRTATITIQPATKGADGSTGCRHV